MFETSTTTEGRPVLFRLTESASPSPARPLVHETPRSLEAEIDAWFRHVSGMNGFTDI